MTFIDLIAAQPVGIFAICLQSRDRKGAVAKCLFGSGYAGSRSGRSSALSLRYSERTLVRNAIELYGYGNTGARSNIRRDHHIQLIDARKLRLQS